MKQHRLRMEAMTRRTKSMSTTLKTSLRRACAVFKSMATSRSTYSMRKATSTTCRVSSWVLQATTRMRMTTMLWMSQPNDKIW